LEFYRGSYVHDEEFHSFGILQRKLLYISIIHEDLFMRFLLEPSCLPLVLTLNKTHPNMLKNCLFLST